MLRGEDKAHGTHEEWQRACDMVTAEHGVQVMVEIYKIASSPGEMETYSRVLHVTVPRLSPEINIYPSTLQRCELRGKQAWQR